MAAAEDSQAPAQNMTATMTVIAISVRPTDEETQLSRWAHKRWSDQSARSSAVGDSSLLYPEPSQP
ncbi:hypothetical protein LKL35_36890 [Streptomyces sp. ET3-23]|uniref:hypothetical protein n=1 Tax=Streptomyces sp. ET3-23 TaxID=2885643 RepID=UPI001D105577|nr:hypothetical protein [Streptomyces sp. ET3-23]MCC2280901.1 hypothetical protein [Streptomyces sp. ET3-23]